MIWNLDRQKLKLLSRLSFFWESRCSLGRGGRTIVSGAATLPEQIIERATSASTPLSHPPSSKTCIKFTIPLDSRDPGTPATRGCVRMSRIHVGQLAEKRTTEPKDTTMNHRQ